MIAIRVARQVFGFSDFKRLIQPLIIIIKAFLLKCACINTKHRPHFRLMCCAKSCRKAEHPASNGRFISPQSFVLRASSLNLPAAAFRMNKIFSPLAFVNQLCFFSCHGLKYLRRFWLREMRLRLAPEPRRALGGAGGRRRSHSRSRDEGERRH